MKFCFKYKKNLLKYNLKNKFIFINILYYTNLL